MSSTVKITSLNGITIGENCTFSSNSVKNASGNVITLPSSAGTVALTSDITSASSTLTSTVNAQKERIDRLLNYLEKWISVGNLSMSDIKATVDPSA